MLTFCKKTSHKIQKMINLCSANINKKYKISNLCGDNFAIKRRLMELGFIAGRGVTVVRKSLIKKTILVEIEGYLLSIRCQVANMIMVV